MLRIAPLLLSAAVLACGASSPSGQSSQKGSIKLSAQTSPRLASGDYANGVCAIFTLQPYSLDTSGNQTLAGTPITIASVAAAQTDTIAGCIDGPTDPAGDNWGYIVTATGFVDCTTGSLVPGLSPSTVTGNYPVDCQAGTDTSLAISVDVSIAQADNAGYIDISAGVDSSEVQVGCKQADVPASTRGNHPQLASMPTTFSDSDFSTGWSTMALTASPNTTYASISGTTESRQAGSGGDTDESASDGYLYILDTVEPANGDLCCDSSCTGGTCWSLPTNQPIVEGLLLNSSATWDPATQGAIYGLDFQVDVKMASLHGQGIGEGFNVEAYIEQGGYQYIASLSEACTPTGACADWHLVSGSFVSGGTGDSITNGRGGTSINMPLSVFAVPFTAGAPPIDFSASGGVMTFGIDLAVSGGQPVLAGQSPPIGHTEGYIDNWKVTVVPLGPMLHFGESYVSADGGVPLGVVAVDTGDPTQFGGVVNNSSGTDTYYTGEIEQPSATTIYQSFVSGCPNAGQEYADTSHAECVSDGSGDPQTGTVALLADVFVSQAGDGFAAASVISGGLLIYSSVGAGLPTLMDASTQPFVGSFNPLLTTNIPSTDPTLAGYMITGLFVDQSASLQFLVSATDSHGQPVYATLEYLAGAWSVGAFQAVTPAALSCKGLYTAPAVCFVPSACKGG